VTVFAHDSRGHQVSWSGAHLTPDNAESRLLPLLNSLTPLVPITLPGVRADQPITGGNLGALARQSVRSY
jgi:hypothetical protein